MARCTYHRVVPKILRSVLAGIIAWLILYGVGQLLDSYLWAGNELDRWTYTTWLAAVCGFAIDRTWAGAPSARSHRTRVLRNIVFGTGWAALAFLLSEVFDVLSNDDHQGSPLRDWAGVAIAVPIVVVFWSVFLRGSPSAKRDPGRKERQLAERIEALREEARKDIAERAIGKLDESSGPPDAGKLKNPGRHAL